MMQNRDKAIAEEADSSKFDTSTEHIPIAQDGRSERDEAAAEAEIEPRSGRIIIGADCSDP